MDRVTEDRAGLRVILVGRTGLDAALRHDPGLELVRAKTPLDAIGELAEPLEPTGPAGAVVIVDPESEPAAGPGSLAEFLAGLRRIDPAVRVFRVARNGGLVPSGYDGSVGADDVAAALREFIERGSRASDPVPPSIEPKPIIGGTNGVQPSPTRGSASPQFVRAEGSAETKLLRAVIDGDSVLPPALEAIRARLAPIEVEFLKSPGDSAPPGWAAWASAPVRLSTSGRLAGELRSRGASVEALEREAAWLAAWLELESKQLALSEAAYRDSLTGAWNRRYFDDFLPRAMEEARASRRALTILLFDIDDFKKFNDQYGHAAGDEILIECVRMISAVVRPTDKVCRVGGDEFAVVFYEPEGPRAPDSRHPSSVFDIAERFRSQVRSAHFRKLSDEAPGCLTISGGLATFPWDGRTPDELVERADQLALEGKRQGKNVIAIGPGCRKLGGA
ncbi:MAG: GGDEF domain-containing protein [Phycisphaerales bacterium]|nr:GGDEF domain-containing protein [Phycisphaerales bacterium]